MILKLFVSNFLSMTVSPEYNNNDSHISLVCSRLLDWFIITMFMEPMVQGERLEYTQHRLLDEPVDMRTNDPTGRCATFATCRQLQFVILPVVTAVCSGVLGLVYLSFAVYIRSGFVICGVNRQDYPTTSREILTYISQLSVFNQLHRYVLFSCVTQWQMGVRLDYFKEVNICCLCALYRG